MADLAHYDRLHDGFTRLLKDLLPTWPMEDDIKYVLEYLAQDEYGEALENLIAVGLHNGVGFSPGQAQQVEALGTAMKMEDSLFLAQLREAGRQAKGHETRMVHAYASPLRDQAIVRLYPGWLGSSLKQVTLTFIALTLIIATSAASIMAASGKLSTAMGDFPPMHSIGRGFSGSITAQILSNGIFFSLLAGFGFACWRARPAWPANPEEDHMHPMGQE